MVKSKLEYSIWNFNIGYTAQWSFYPVKSFGNGAQSAITFFQDEKKLEICVVSNFFEPVVVVFDYKSLSFVNVCKNNTATIGYKHPPKCYAVNLIRRNRLTGETEFVDYFVKGSAISFDLQSDDLLKKMMNIFELEVTDKDFPVKANIIWPIFTVEVTNFYLAAVISLGFPGNFMLRQYGYIGGYCWMSDELLERIYYHVKGDRRLPVLVLQEYYRPSMDVSNYVLIKSAYVTPSQIILVPPTWQAPSQGIRRVNSEKLLSVDFRDDDLQQLPQMEKTMIAAVIDKCKNGLKICGKDYNELFCSSSKFREHSSLFYQGQQWEILTILRSLGDFEPASPAKLGARIGLNSSAVRKGVVPYWFAIAEDVKCPLGKYEFTDGCGQVSESFAYRLAKQLKLDFVPSAFQFRFPGFKGVLLVSKSRTMSSYEVVFRKSQHKFNGFTDRETLDVITFSTPATMCLNKNFIEVLCQNAAKWGDVYKQRVEKRILELAKASIVKLINKCLDPDKFTESLERLPKYLHIEKMPSYSKDELLAEPFLRGLVQSDSLMHLKYIYEKSKIVFPAHLGRQMLGVPDFDGYLEPGQVFVQYSVDIDGTNGELKVLQGVVAVTRSPQFNLNDIRFAQAVDVPQYRHLKDVIVFSIKGSRPMQDEMAGGDLDGDDYSVFWDPELMLPGSQPAVEFTAPEYRGKIATIGTIQRDYLEFRKEYMSTEPIGAYANAHTVLAEHFGYDDYTVLELAKKLDVHINYFKSGIAAPKMQIIERVQFYPEHMRKDNRSVYRLDNLLSKIHSMGEAFFLDAKDAIKADKKFPIIDQLIHVEGWEVYSSDARRLYNAFKRQVDRIQIQHGIASVTELFAGRITEFNYRISHYVHDNDPVISLLGLIQNSVLGLMKAYREELMKGITAENLEKLAVACYRVAYACGACLAFPWTLWDVLETVRSKNKLKKPFVVTFQTRLLEGADLLTGFFLPISSWYPATLSALLQRQILPSLKLSVDDASAEKMVKSYVSWASNTLTVSPGKEIFSCISRDVLNFYKYYGVLAYDRIRKDTVCFEIAEKCREMYLEVAFGKNPQIAKLCYKQGRERFYKIALDVNCSIVETAFLDSLESKTGCKVDVRLFKTDRRFYSYFLVAHGSKSAIKKVQSLFVLKDNEDDVVDNSKFNKMMRLSQLVNNIQREKMIWIDDDDQQPWNDIGL